MLLKICYKILKSKIQKMKNLHIGPERNEVGTNIQM
jgi:hypothetical protein